MTPAKVLVVEDDLNIRLMIRTSLEAAGHRVTEAENGRVGLELVNGRETFDVVVLDLSMPVLDGMGMLNQMATTTRRRPPVIVLTAYGSIPAAVKATLAGASDFLEKPSTPQELCDAVARLLDATPRHLSMPADELAGGYEAVLQRIRQALKAGAWENAESLLMKAADLSLRDAAYFNLLGVLYEARRDFDLAGKFYHKAMRAKPGGYEPADQNLRRLYEFRTFDKSNIEVELGEKPAVLLRYR